MAVAKVNAGLSIRRELLHAVTRDGSQHLIVAKGDVTPLQKAIAAWNSRRWKAGKRTWLL